MDGQLYHLPIEVEAVMAAGTPILLLLTKGVLEISDVASSISKSSPPASICSSADSDPMDPLSSHCMCVLVGEGAVGLREFSGFAAAARQFWSN